VVCLLTHRSVIRCFHDAVSGPWLTEQIEREATEGWVKIGFAFVEPIDHGSVTFL
jgi:hypothetical protein